MNPGVFGLQAFASLPQNDGSVPAGLPIRRASSAKIGKPTARPQNALWSFRPGVLKGIGVGIFGYPNHPALPIETRPCPPGTPQPRGWKKVPGPATDFMPSGIRDVGSAGNIVNNQWAYMIGLPNGQAFVMSGSDTSGVGTALLYDPATDTYSGTTLLPENRSTFRMCALLDGRVFLIGGGDLVASQARDYPWIRSAAGAWTKLAVHPFGQGYIVPCTLRDGRVFVCTSSREAYIWNPGNSQWTQVASPLPNLVTNGFALALLPDGRVFYALGDSNGATGIYDPTNNTWVSGPTLPGPGNASGMGGLCSTPSGALIGYMNNQVCHYVTATGAIEFFSAGIPTSFPILAPTSGGILVRNAGSGSTTKQSMLTPRPRPILMRVR